MRISKKILAIALSILMAVSMMPFTVFAATTGVANGAELKAAVESAASGDVIEFTADNTTYPGTDGALVIDVNGKDITIDLKGHTQYFRVSGETTVVYETALFYIHNGAKLTIKDSVGGGAMYMTYGANSPAYMFIQKNNANEAAHTSELVINGGKFVSDAPKYGGILIYQNYADATTTINDGEFVTSTGSQGRRDYIVNESRGELEINGGTFTTARSFDYVISEGNTTETSLTINGGTFNGTMSLDTTKATTELNGGTYKTNDGAANTVVSKYLPADEVIDSTTGQIKDVDASTVARIDSAEFTSLTDAVAACTNTSSTTTITMVKDTTEAAPITISNGAKITINANGCEVTCTDRVFIIRHGQLTFNNGTIYSTTDDGVAVYGAATDSGSNYSTFTLGTNAVINAPNYFGAMIGNNNGGAYGAKITISSTAVVNSKYGIYINGSVAEPETKTNAAAISITGTINGDNAEPAIYAAGYAKWTIGGTSYTANITAGSGIYIKSGDMTITNANITAVGQKADYVFNANGADGTGDAIIIDSCGYPGNIPTVTIKGGTITSANGEAVASYAKQDDPRYPDATYPVVDQVIPGTSTAVFSSDVSALAAEGYETTYDTTAGGYVVAEDDHTVAIANGVKFDNFEDALASISTVTSATHNKATDPTYEYKTYVANGEIKLMQDVDGNGLIIGEGSDLTIDFNGHTYDVVANPVGSNGTETIGLQLLKNSDITFKNGTLTSTADWDVYVVRLIQNYSNLTLDNMTVGMNGNFMDQTTMANCNGSVVINDSTVSAPDFSAYNYDADEAAELLGAQVFTVGTFSTYTGVDVTVTGDSTINGNVKMDNDTDAGTAALSLEGSDVTVNGEIVVESFDDTTVTNTGATVGDVSDGYEWSATGALQPVADGFNLTVEDKIHMNLYVNVDAYGDTMTVTYNDPSKKDGSKITDTYTGADLAALKDAQDGRYVVSILAAPAQITDEVTVTVGDHSFTTSVKAYCDAIIADGSNAEFVALAQAMLDYGKAANAEFNYVDADNFADYINKSDVTANIEAEAFCEVTGTAGVFTGYSYIATSIPSLRIYVSATEAECVAQGLKASVNGVEVDPTVVEGTDKVCIDITGIKAENFADIQEVTFNGATIRINALQYAKAKGGNFGRSMYNYYVAADAAF